jgi:hypothetical protein
MIPAVTNSRNIRKPGAWPVEGFFGTSTTSWKAFISKGKLKQ